MERIELTNGLRKQITGLAAAKNRKASGLFVAEGTRCVLEILGHTPCRYLVATKEWIDYQFNQCDSGSIDSLIAVSPSEMERLSQQKTPQPVLAVFVKPHYELDLAAYHSRGGLYLALDRVQDPGNLGTIVRLADWFGITDLFCSVDTVDVYNPKVIQATMGAVVRVRIHYVDLPDMLSKIELPVYGTFLDGDDIYRSPLSASGVIVMGNEGNGISSEVEQTIDRRILIPPFPPCSETVESLNVGVAAAITVAEFRRRER